MGALTVRKEPPDNRADYIVICAPWVTDDPTNSASFAHVLAEGKSVPWLEPVKLEPRPLMAWRVHL